MSLLSLLAGAFNGGNAQNNQLPPLQNQPTTVDPVSVSAPNPLGGAVLPAPTPVGHVQGPKLSDGSLLGPLSNQTMPALLASMGGVPQSKDGASMNYDNSGDVSAIHSALDSNTTRGGSANPGIYGLLPSSLQHGTMRNVLGAIGDAFLTGSGHDPRYGPNMQRQQLGDAMAGYDPNDPAKAQAAIARVAATGVPGAAEMADKMQQQFEQARLRQQYMEYNQSNREQMMDYRDNGRLQQMTPYVGGMISSAKDPASYATAYNRVDQMVKRINPKYSPSDLGLPDPGDWQPGMTDGWGATANNLIVSGDKRTGQQISTDNNIRNNKSRENAARIGAGGHVEAAGVSAGRPTPTTQLQTIQDKVNRGEQLSPGDQAVWDKATAIPKGSRRRTGQGGTGQAGSAGGAGPVAYGPGGKRVQWNGKAWVPL